MQTRRWGTEGARSRGPAGCPLVVDEWLLEEADAIEPPAGADIVDVLERAERRPGTVEDDSTVRSALESDDPGERHAGAQVVRHLAEDDPAAAHRFEDGLGTRLDAAEHDETLLEIFRTMAELSAHDPGEFADDVGEYAGVFEGEMTPEARRVLGRVVANVIAEHPGKYWSVEDAVTTGLESPYPRVRALAIETATHVVGSGYASVDTEEYLEAFLDALSADHPGPVAAGAAGIERIGIREPDTVGGVPDALLDVLDVENEEAASRVGSTLLTLLFNFQEPVDDAVNDAIRRAADPEQSPAVREAFLAASHWGTLHPRQAGDVDPEAVEALVAATDGSPPPAEELEDDTDFRDSTALVVENVARERPAAVADVADTVARWAHDVDADRDEPNDDPWVALGALAEARESVVREALDGLVDSLSDDAVDDDVVALELAGFAEHTPGLVVDALGIDGDDASSDGLDDPLGDQPTADVLRGVLAGEVEAYATPELSRRLVELTDEENATSFYALVGLETLARVDPVVLEPHTEDVVAILDESFPVLRLYAVRILGELGAEEPLRDAQYDHATLVEETAGEYLGI